MMMKMMRGPVLGCLTATALIAGTMAPAQAASEKETDCGYQATVVAAIKQARIDRVAERKVPEHLAETATWPEKYNAAVPLMTPWVYEMKMRDVKNQDLAAAWNEMCLLQ